MTVLRYEQTQGYDVSFIRRGMHERGIKQHSTTTAGQLNLCAHFAD